MNDDHRAQLQAYMHMTGTSQVNFVGTPWRAGKSTLVQQMQGYNAALKHDDKVDATINVGIPTARPYPLYAILQLIEALHMNGLRDRKSLVDKSNRELDRFLTKAMKRAHSNHPRDRRWKPLLAVVIAAQVAHALETS